MKTSTLFAVAGVASLATLAPIQAAQTVENSQKSENWNEVSPLDPRFTNVVPNYTQRQGIIFGGGIRGVYGNNGQELYGFDLPSVGGVQADVHLEFIGEKVSHEISLNFSYLYGKRTEDALYIDERDRIPGDLTFKTESTAFALGYLLNIAPKERTTFYVGAKAGISLNTFKESFSVPHWGDIISNTTHHNCFTPSFLAGVKIHATERVMFTVGYELYIPTGQMAGHHIDPYHCAAIGLTFDF
jgi:opacity protein-like surface antigen